MLFVASCASLVLLLAPQARAEGGGLEGGLRIGYAKPSGKASGTGSNPAVNEYVDYLLPAVWADAGYRLNAAAFVGVYAQYGIASVDYAFPTTCGDNGEHCSGNSARAGIQLNYHLSPGSVLDSWFGYGLGFEWFEMKQRWTSEASTLDWFNLTATGIEAANFQVGVDVRVVPHVLVGPFISFSVDEYDSVRPSCAGSVCDYIKRDISHHADDPSTHFWIFFGIRGSFTTFTPSPK